MRDGEASGSSGNHIVFLTGDATPRPLVALRTQEEDGASSPIARLYNCGHAALYYDCDDPDVIRKSTSVDRHMNTILEEDVQLLDGSSSNACRGKRPLTESMTDLPTIKYATHFHNFLFDSVALKIIPTKLGTLNVPPAPNIPNSGKCLPNELFERYKKDKWAHLPLEVKRMETDVYLEGTCPRAVSF